MRDRLAARATAIKRKRNRTGDHGEFAILRHAVSSSDPWANVPESQRKTEITVSGGQTITTYVDTLEDITRPSWTPAELLIDTLVEEDTDDAIAEPMLPFAKAEVAPRPDIWSDLEDADRRDVG